MKKKKLLAILFFLLLMTNLFIYFNRKHFDYLSYPMSASLYATCDNSCNKHWRQSIEDYPATELAEAANFIQEYLHNNHLSTKDKILQISGFLYQRFHAKQERPSYSLMQASPLDQFKKLNSDDSSKIWCGIYASIFNYFCWSQDIVCRNIEIIKPGDHHVVNECYLPETGQWAMVDITSNVLLVQDKNKQLMSLLSFITELQDGNTLSYYRSEKDIILTDELTGSTFQGSHYFQKKYSFYYYYRVNLKKIYSLPSKIKRYIMPSPYYSIYNFNYEGRNHFFFYTKLFFIYSWILVSALLIKQLLFNREKNNV